MGPGTRLAVRARCAAQALVGAMLFVTLLAPGRLGAQAPAAPAPGWMTYTNRRTVADGAGAYAGYSDHLEAAGRYDFATDAGALDITASYRWRYIGERCEDGAVERHVVVGLDDRLYERETDLDDYDDRPGAPFATWVWVPPTLVTGDHARILERDFVVVGEESVSLEALAAPVSAIHLRAEGTDRRDDAYGSFQTRFVDDYWFDRASGYFLRSVYREHDDGTFEGAPASFAWTEAVEANAASYLPGTTAREIGGLDCDDPVPPPTASTEELGIVAAVLGGGACVTFAMFVAPILFFVGLFVLIRRSAQPRLRIQGQSASVRLIHRIEELPPIAPEDSPRFAPFLRHFVEHALLAREAVAVCELADDKRCVGLGIADREGRISSIFARDGDACELLRARLGWTEIFTEHRHEVIPSVLAAAQAARSAKVPHAYNVLETYEILEHAAPSAQAYDTTVVARMTSADLADVSKLSEEVYGIAGAAWLAAALEAGDVGYVARVDGALAGYGLASVCGGVGRLYGNTVSSAHRGKGLGRELVRARVSGCVALGASRILTEVATWNVGSLEILRAQGFATSGTMWVESSLAIRPERKVVRR
jgi:L-amino acid N-acyltransferase YncA